MSLKSDFIFHRRVERIVAAGYSAADANKAAFAAADDPALTNEIVIRYTRGESIDRLRRSTPHSTKTVRMILIGEGVTLRGNGSILHREAVKDTYGDEDFEAFMLGVSPRDLERKTNHHGEIR